MTIRDGRLLSVARVAAASLLLAAGTLQAQDARLTARLDADLAQAVSRVVDSAKTAGLPSEPLIGVALEGAGRRATADQILAAVRWFADALGQAKAALGTVARDDEIVSGAGVVVAGVAPAVLRDYRSARPELSLTVPLVVLADLIARGVPADSAAAALGAALHAGVRDAQLADFRRKVEHDILRGARPSAAMTMHLKGVPGGGGAKAPSTPSTPSRPRRIIGRPGPW
jgi:hypothetical protein